MKTLLLTLTLAFASATLLTGLAQAADDAPAAASSPTRAEVKAELAKARADGTLNQKPNQDLGVAKPKAAKTKKAKKKAKAAADAASAAQ